jgi:hypothetical protein
MNDAKQTGYLGGWKLVGKTPPGTCEECAVAHDPSQPHNAQSLAYQYKFYDKNGRWPNWNDAMAHCRPEVIALWREALITRGVDIDNGGVNPTKK